MMNLPGKYFTGEKDARITIIIACCVLSKYKLKSYHTDASRRI